VESDEMSRIFGRGELKEAVLLVLDSLGEAHGYAVMDELKDRVGGGWKPSPGAIYPALLALVDVGHVKTTHRDGTRLYSLSKEGRRAAEALRSNIRWASLTARAEEGEDRISIGSLLDRFAEDSPLRRRLAHTEQREQIESILARAGAEIEGTLEEGEDDG
jgi:DNA-binding PadR family transcriptional regulator